MIVSGENTYLIHKQQKRLHRVQMQIESSLLRQINLQVNVEAVVPKRRETKTAAFTCIGSTCRHGSYTIIKAPSKQVRARLLLKPRPDSCSLDAFYDWLSALKRTLFPCVPTCILPEGLFGTPAEPAQAQHRFLQCRTLQPAQGTMTAASCRCKPSCWHSRDNPD